MTNGRIPDALIQSIRDRVTLSDFIGQHVHLKRQGREHVGCCPFHQEKTPSFKVNDAKQVWACFGCGAKGDCIDFAQHIYRISFRQAVDALAGENGLHGSGATIDPAVSDRAAKRRADAEAERAKFRAAAMNIWENSLSAEGSPVEAYLRSRSIEAPIPPSIRYNPEVRYRTGEKSFLVLPAMISAFTNSADEVSAIHRTYLKRDGSGKADVPKPKSILGDAAGCAVRLFAGLGSHSASISELDTVNVTEGIETGLSLQQLNGYATLAAGSTGGIIALQLPEIPFGRRIIIGADNDANGAGMKAAETAATRLRGEGREVEIQPPKSAKDWNDVLRARSVGERLERPLQAAGGMMRLGY